MSPVVGVALMIAITVALAAVTVARLYYTAFDAHQIEMLTKVMD